MQLNADPLLKLEALAIDAAKRAGAMIQSRVKEDVEVRDKESGSSLASQVVTEVDLESQRIILEMLSDSMERYGLGLLTEESPDDSSRHTHDHYWCIDPMDGTLAFTASSAKASAAKKREPGGYSVSIALVAKDGTPVIGVVFDPVSNTLYHAVKGQGAKKNGEPWKMASAGNTLSLFIDNSFIAQASSSDFRDKLQGLAEQHGCDGVKIIDHQGAVLNACSVADRAPALYFKFPKPTPGGGSLWDFAATACLFAEMGLPCSDIHGEALDLNPEGSTFMNHCGVRYASSSELAAGVNKLS